MVVRALIVMVLLALVIPAASGYAADVAAGKKLSAQHCAKCHGDTGKGDGSGLKKIEADVKPVDWTDKVAMAKWKDTDLTNIIKEGGEAAGKSKTMPAYGEKLTDAQIADVAAYVRSLAK